MFSFQQIAHFQAFGYIVLPSLLSGPEITRLRGEVVTALGDAFGEGGREPADESGIAGTTCRSRSIERR